MSTYLERLDKKKKEEEQSSSYSTYLDRQYAKNIISGKDTFLQDYNNLVNSHNQTLKQTNSFLKSNDFASDDLHSNIINDSDNFNDLRDKLSKFRNEFVSRYGETSVSKMEDRLSNLGQSIKSNSKAIENIKTGKNAIKQEEEKQSNALFPSRKTQSNKVSSLEVNEAKQLTGNPTDILFNNPTAEQDEALVKNTRGYANKYANMSYAQLKDTVAKNSSSMSNEEKNFVTKFTTNKLSEEGTAKDVKNEYEQLIKNGADENSPEVSHLKEMYQNKYDNEVYNKLSNLSDDDVIKALYSDITVGYGADTKTQNWVQKEHLKYDDVKSYITNYGSLSLLKKYRDYLKDNGEYTDRNELAHSLLGDTSVFDSTKNKNEDEINQLDDIITIREQEKNISDKYDEYSQNSDWDKLSRQKAKTTLDKYAELHKNQGYSNPNGNEPKTSSESDLTKEEAVYNYIYNKFGEDKANDYKNSISKYSNYVTAQEERHKTQEYAKEHPVLGTLESVLTNLGNTLSLLPLADIVDNTIGIDIDVNDDLHTASRKTNDLREGVKSNLGETGQFVYDTAMSAVDSASYVALGNALGVAGEAAGIANATNYVPEIVNGLMGNIVAQQAIVEGKEKGYSDTKAVSMGIIQAAIEAITEQYSLDSIIKHPNLLKGALVEGSEEVASNWLNNVVDAVANGDKNRYRQAIDEYKKENPNASNSEALASAICDSFKDDGLSFLAGGLSGAAMSGTQMGVNKVKKHSVVNQFKNSQIEVLDNIINDEKFNDTELQYQVSVLKNKVNNNEEITYTDEVKLQNAQMRTALKNIVPKEVINNTAVKTDIEVATENGAEKVKSSFGTKHPNGILATVNGTDTKAVTNIVSSNSGKMALQTDTGDTVQLEDVQFNSPSQKAIFEQASKYDTNGAKQYVIAVDNFKGKSKNFNKAFDALYKLGNSGSYNVSYDKLYQTNNSDYAYKGDANNVAITENPEQASHYVYDNAINPSSSAEELSPSQQKLIADAEKARNVLGIQSMNIVNAGWNDYISVRNENKRLLQLTKDTIEHYNTLEDIAQEEVIKQQSDEQNEESLEKEPIKLPKNESDKLYNELVNKFKGREDEFTDLWGKAYYAGARGVSYNSVAKNINYLDVIRQIGSKDVQRIMEAGRRDSVAKVKDLMQNSKPQKKTSSKVVVAKSSKGKVKNTAVFEHIANNIGTDIYVDDIKDKRINGYLDKKGIHINVNHGQEGMLFAISHEAVHALKLSNIKGYTELKNYVMDILTDSGMNIDSRTVAVINNYLETNSLNMDNLTEEAEEEIVANAFGSIINNEKAMKKAYSLPSSKKKNLVSAIKSIISKLKEFLNKLSNQMPEVKALKDNINAQIKMAEIFARSIEQYSTDEQKKNTHSNENRTDVVDNKIRYSVNPKFADEVDRAFKDGTIKDKTFILGETSDVLQALGARENSIYMNGDKMVTILSKHPEMSINTIKNIPQLIDNPVLVLKSKNKVNNNSRVVVFGRYKAENGKPMLAVIDLLPREDKLVINDMQKLVSSYTKTNNINETKSYLENSEVMYVTENKKVAKNLIGRVGFYMPTELRHFGYIGNIAYKDRKVKLSGVPFNEVFKYDEISDTKAIQKLGANLPGKKFSIFEDGTEKNLVAMHNLSADNLETALKRGGLPMPSIAVTKDSISHNEFGEVSVLFDKDTIDPEQDNNYVYGNDVFSPTYPGLEYKVNEDKGREVYQYVQNLLRNKKMAFKVNPVKFHPSNLSDELNSLKGEASYIKSLENDYGIKNLYLSLSNNQVDSVNNIEKTEVKKVDELTADFYNYIYNTMGDEIETARNMTSGAWYKQNKEQLTNVVRSYVNAESDSNTRGQKEELVKKNTFNGFKASSLAKNIINFKDNNGKIVNTKTTQDIEGAQKEIESKINQKDYEKWLNDTFTGIVEKSGIRKPNVDAFTQNGNRRSFEQLHYADTLDNIVRAMKEVQNGESFFGGNQLWAIGSKEYSSISSIKNDLSRLQKLDEEEYKNIKSGFGKRFDNIAKKLKGNNDSYLALDSAYNNIADAVRNSNNEGQMLKELKEYYPKTATSEIVNEIINLLDDVSNMPTGYFEAKPQRVISPSEIKAVVLPAETSASVIDLLKKNNIPYYEYTSDNRTSVTQKAINDTKIRFSKFADKIKKEETRSEKALKDVNKTAAELLAMTDEKGYENNSKFYRDVAKTILQKYDCNYSPKTFGDNMKTVADYAMNQKILDSNDYVNQMTYVANEALDNYRQITDKFTKERETVKKYLKDKTLILTDSQKELLDYGIGTDTFINKMRGMANIVANSDVHEGNTMYLQEAYETLQNELGIDFLPMANANKIPDNFLQLKEILKPHINVDGMNRFDVALNMVQDYITELAKKKYSNKNTDVSKKINQLMSQQKKWNIAVKQEYNQKLKAEKKKYNENLEKYQADIGEYKQRTTYEKHKEITALKAKQRDTLEWYKNRRMQTVYKDKIRRLCNKLARMTDHETRKEGIPMPTDLIKNMSRLADFIDPGTTKNGNVVSGYVTFMKMKSIYDGLSSTDAEANQVTSQGIYANHYQKAISYQIEKLAYEIGDKPLNKLDGYKLKNVYDVLFNIENNFREAKKIIIDGKNIEINKMGKQIIYDLKHVQGNLKINSTDKKVGMTSINKFTNYGLDFIRFTKRIVNYNENSPLVKLAEEFDRADSKEAKIKMESMQIFTDVMAKMKATKADGHKHKSLLDVFDGKNAEMLDFGLKDRFNDQKVKITPAMAVSIYQMSQNEDNKRHFVLGRKNGRTVDIPGGLNIPDNKLWLKGKFEEAKSQHHTVVMSEKTLDKITEYVISNKLLLEFSNATDKFFNEVSRKYMDETAKRLYGYPISIKSHYFPVSTNNNYVKTNFETVILDASLENTGFTKHRTKGHNPIWLDDVTSVINSHMNRLAKYASYTPIIKDFQKVYNYTAPNYRTSVKDEIERKWGKSATNYIENFIADLQKQYRSNPKLSKVRGGFAQSVLAMNLSVTMKQAASYPTAAAIIGYKPLAKALAYGENAEGEKKILFYRANRAEINSMTGVFFDRYQGDNTAEMREFINSDSWAKKVPYLMNWIQKADVATTGRLWQACKYYVEDELIIQKYKNGTNEYTDEYKKALVETYEKVIKNTQPMYSTVHRPAVLRSHNEIIRTLTMFMTQRLQNFGIMVEATGNYRAKAKEFKSDPTDANKKALDKAKKQFVRSITSQVVAGMTLSAMTLLANALTHRLDRYRDDEGEITWLSVLSTFGLDFMETMSGCVLWGYETYEVISNIIKVSNGGTVYNSDIVDLGVFNTINDLQDAIIGTIKTCTDDEFDGDKFIKYTYKIASCFAKAFGIPLDNAKNLLMGGVNLVKDCVDNGSPFAFKAGSNISLTSGDYGEHLYEYLINNDREGYTRLFNKAMADGIEGKNIQTAIKEQLIGNEFVQKAAVALNDNDIDTYNSSYEVLLKQGFQTDTIKRAIDGYIKKYLHPEEEEKTDNQTDYTEKELFDNQEGQSVQYSFDDLWRAKESGSSTYSTIYNALIAQGKKPSAIKSAMKAREKKKKKNK